MSTHLFVCFFLCIYLWQKVFAMRKSSSYILLIGFFAFMIGRLFSMFHIHEMGRYFALWAIFLVIIGLLMRLFIPNAPGMWTSYRPSFQRFYRFSHRAIDLGALFLFTGVLGKIIHISGSELIMKFGLIIFVVGCACLGVVLQTKNRFFVDSPADALLTAADLEKYAGIYACEQLKTSMAVTVVDNHLFGQMKGQGVFRVSAVKEDIFNNLTLKVVIEFYPARNELVLIQHGGYFTFVKQ